MTDGHRVDTGSGVPVAASASETAAELAQVVREATRDLPFGVEPASFLVVLEILADAGESEE
jgi:hypothetical protein